jgi:hypothetical protein
MRTIVAAVLLAASGGVVAGSADAQIPMQFAIEGRIAPLAVPFGVWNISNDVDRGYGGGGNVQLWLSNRLGMLAGWESMKFNLDRPDLEQQGAGSYAVDRGYRFGLMTPYPLIFAGTGALFLYAGGTFNKTTFLVHDNREAFSVTSNADLGYEAGTTLNIPVGNIYVVSPSLRYRGHKAVFGPATEVGPNETTVEYLVVDIGLKVNLGPRPTVRTP